MTDYLVDVAWNHKGARYEKKAIERVRASSVGRAATAAIAKKEQQEESRRREEEYKRERAERDQEERERIEGVLAGEKQPYDGMLHEVLYREEKTQRNWIGACERGADNHRVKMMVMEAFGQGGGLNVPGQTSLSWKGGYSPKLWLGPAVGMPILEGDGLIDQVRRVMRIPAPITDMDPEDESVRTCRICGCSEFDPCVEGCAWVEQDLCSNPGCLDAADYTPEEIAKVEAGESPRAPAESSEGGA